MSVPATSLRSPPALDCRGWTSALSRLIEGQPTPQLKLQAERERVAQLAQRLPAGLLAALSDFRDNRNDSGALWLRDLPAWQTSDDDERRERTALLGALLSCVLGDPIGYAQIDDGALVRDVRPTREEALQQSAKSSGVPLELHTEQHFHPFTPHHVLLLCLRGHPDAITTTVGVEELYPRLAVEDLDALSKPQFNSGLDYVFGNAGQHKGNGPAVSVLAQGAGGPVLRYDADLMLATTAQGQAALQAFERHSLAVLRGVNLQAGEALLLDNERAAHGRSTFQANFDQRDRWLLQLKTRRWLPPPGEHRQAGSTILQTAF